jgi:serine/threonine protein kinase
MNPLSEPIAPDTRVTAAVEEYLAAWDAGNRPSREEFLAWHADIGDALAECLDGLDFIRSAAPGLKDSASTTSIAESIHPEGPLGDFRIVREIGRGGMGVVYEAVQISLGRRVALKVLPFASTLDPKQLQRFKNEAQAAANLHHTNIVPVYATGCQRGVHYYAMQFIEGQTLAQAIAELRQSTEPRPPSEPRPLEGEEHIGDDTTAYLSLHNGRGPAATRPVALIFTERSRQSPAYFRSVAQLGVQAAEALEHAHQLGIVHRDIKPANLLIEGEPGLSAPGVRLWITDFGLAHCQSQAGLTMTGDVVGTLRYMSPEQALGNRALVDHRTDVYSLGATLYELLTLQPAFAGHNRQELLRQIGAEEPTPPRRLSPMAPAELETIVFKAMEKNPEERYGAAQALADDLRRFLEDKPIRAKRPTLLQRVRKWARRYRPAVLSVLVSAGIMAVLALVGLMISIILIERQRAEAIANFHTAEEQRRLAEVRAAEAEASFRKCVQLVEDQFTLVSQSTLFESPGLQSLRKDLLEKALNYYQELLDQRPGDPKLRVEIAATYLRLYQIYEVLDRRDQGALALQRGLQIIEGLLREYPASSKLFRPLAGFSRGGRFIHTETRSHSDPVAALGLLQKAALIWEDFVRANLDIEGFESDLAAFYLALTQPLTLLSRIVEREKCVQGAHTLREKQARAHPRDPEYQLELARAEQRVALTMLAREQVAAAEQLARQTLERTRRLTAEWPKIVTYQADLASHHAFLGRILLVGHRFAEAEKVLLQALAMFEKLAAELPGLPFFREAAGQLHYSLGYLWTSTGRNAEAEAAHRRALNIFEKLVADFPDELCCHELLARGHVALATYLVGTTERLEESVAAFHKVILEYEKRVADFPEMQEDWDKLANYWSWFDDLLDNMGRKPPPEECHRVVAMFEKRVAEKSAVALYRTVLAGHYGYLGDHEKDAGRHLQAEQLYLKAVDLQEKLVADRPTVARYRLNLARRLERLRDLYDDLARLPDALAAIRRAIAIQEAAPTDGLSEFITNWWLTKGHALRQTGFLQVRLNEPEWAQSSFRDAATAFQRLSAASPTMLNYRHFQADSTRVLADLLARAGQDEEAEHAYRKAVQVFDELLRDFSADRLGRASELLRGYTHFIHFLKQRDRSEEAQEILLRAKRAHRRIMEQSSTDAKELRERAKADALMKEAAGVEFQSQKKCAKQSK